MTSVLPPWKLELIERKKKKEQDERLKLEDERSRKVSIPEWKRSLLEKKKEGPSDSPETKGQALSVNSVFGPRILRKTSEKTIAIANASQRPVTEVDDDNISERKVFGENATRSHGSLYSSPADSNSCVTKAVEIPTEVVHKTNKHGFLQREVENYRESTQRSDGTLSIGDSKVSVPSDVQSAGVQWAKTKVDNEPVKAPSVLSFRRMFEQSKPADKTEIRKNTESIKADARNEKRTTESKLVAANDDSQLHVSNKSTGDNAQSIHMEKPTSLHASETNQLKTAIASPPPTIASKPYKSFVSTPPWLKNTSVKNVTFSTGKESVQEATVANVNNEVEDVSKDILKSDQKSVVTVESDVKEKAKKTLNHSDLAKLGSASEPGRDKPVEPDMNKRNPQLILQDQTVQKYSIVKQSEVEEEQKAVKPVKESGNQKYVVITNRKQQELTRPSEKAVTVISTDNVSQVSNELVPHKDNQEENKDDFARHSSIESVRSMFGPSVGFRRRTSSEENLSVSESIEHGSVLRRPGQSKRTQSATVRWSADVLSLMSQPIDDDDDDDGDSDMSMLSPRSDSEIPSSNSSKAKRPPPPMKRWTADVLSVISQSFDSDSSNLSPRSDSSVTFSPSNSLNRARSSSLSDIREEQGLDYFQHKPNVSQGIEHRMHKLIRRLSISETSLHAEEGDSDSDSVSDDESSGLNDMDFNSKEAPNAQVTLKGEITDHALVDTKDSQPPLFPVEQEIQPVFARKHSISHDIEHRVCELFHRQLSQQSDGGESEGEKTWESDGKISTDQNKVETLQKTSSEPVTEAINEKSTDLVSTSLENEPKEDSDLVVPESKPSKGSVHKLSALFGSSIWKPNKKDKGSSEEKPKIKASVESKPQKIPLTEKLNLKESSAKTGDSKKSSLFGKSQKTEDKAVVKKEKEPSNGSFFPWLKKRDKEEERPGQNKTTNVEGKIKKNSGSSSSDEVADTVPIATHGLQPVHRTEKVEQKQRLVGKVMIISNASQEQAPPKGVYHKPKPSFQLPEQEKEKTPAQKSNNYSKPADFKRKEAQIPTIVTQHWNGNQKSPELSEKRTSESVPITSIDEVPVSSIDMPESGNNDVAVSVIDVPVSPDVCSAGKFVFLNGNAEESSQPNDDVSVSVIDLPSPVAKEDAPYTIQDGHLEADELSDGSDTDEVEGSYDFATGEITHHVNGDIAPEDDEDDDEEDDDDDDEEEDEDEDVPISYIGAAPRYPVPQVVFDSEPVQLKSCLSPKLGRRKVKKGNVSFKGSHMIHDYPSEEIAKVVFDELQNNNNVQLKTLQNYRPAGLVNMEKNMVHTGGNVQVQITQSVSNGEKRVHDISNGDSHPEIKYADEGQGFTDATDSASALLF